MVTKRSWLAILVIYTDMIKLWGDPELDRISGVVTGVGGASPVETFSSADEKHAGIPIGSCIIFGHTISTNQNDHLGYI